MVPTLGFIKETTKHLTRKSARSFCDEKDQGYFSRHHSITFLIMDVELYLSPDEDQFYEIYTKPIPEKENVLQMIRNKYVS